MPVMIPRSSGSLLLSLALATTSALCRAGEPDPDLPQPFDPSALRALATHSPFNRVVDFSSIYRLTGVAYVEGKPIATLLNTETKQHIVVSETPNAKGWKLTEATPTTMPKHAGVKLLVDGEIVELRYDVAAAAAEQQAQHNRTGFGGVSGGRRVVEPVDIHNLQESDYIRKGSDGKEYVRGSIYLPTKDRDYYYNDMSREARDKYRQIIEDNRDRMFRYNPDQRASFSKAVFDKVIQDEKSGRR